jgi:hypothetical protein
MKIARSFAILAVAATSLPASTLPYAKSDKPMGSYSFRLTPVTASRPSTAGIRDSGADRAARTFARRHLLRGQERQRDGATIATTDDGATTVIASPSGNGDQ